MAHSHHKRAVDHGYLGMHCSQLLCKPQQVCEFTLVSRYDTADAVGYCKTLPGLSARNVGSGTGTRKLTLSDIVPSDRVAKLC